jgi:MFS family permease
LPVIVRERLNGDAKQTGILFGSIAIGILIATPIFGILSDYYRTRKRPMISALLISASATLCFAYARNFWQLLLARILQGAAGGASWTISLSMIADAFPAHNLGIAMSSTLVWNSFGFLAGPAIGGFLFEYGGYAMPFFFCTGCAIFAIICTAIVKPPVLYFEELTPDEILGADAPDEATEHTALLRNSDVLVGGQSSMPDPIEESLAQGYWETESDYALSGISGISQSPTQLNMLRLVREQPIILNCLTILTAASVFSGIEPTLPIHLADRFHMEPSVIGMMFMAILLPHMLAGPIVGWMCDRIAPKTVASVGLVVFALATPPIAVPDKVQTEVIVLMLFGTMAAVVSGGCVCAFARTTNHFSTRP